MCDRRCGEHKVVGLICHQRIGSSVRVIEQDLRSAEASWLPALPGQRRPLSRPVVVGATLSNFAIDGRWLGR